MRTQPMIFLLLMFAGIFLARRWENSDETKIRSLSTAFARPTTLSYPSENGYSPAKAALGERLFFDTRLSGTNTMACATCHNPDLSWGNGLRTGIGHQGIVLRRKVPSLYNVDWGWSFFWDGRAKTLEEQALLPIQNKDEMDLSLPELTQKLQKISEYPPLFEEAFPGQVISGQTIANALATFERTIESGPTSFDAWILGDAHAISEDAQRGFILFNEKANCVKCHSGWNFTNGSFADTGVGTEDRGRGEIIAKPSLAFTFKTPSLRHIAKRAPYMHDGSIPTLEAVIEHYDRGGTFRRSSTQKFLRPLHLEKQEKKDLLAFLRTLTNEEAAATNVTSLEGESHEKR
jgi:cytochrome c peroxidase